MTMRAIADQYHRFRASRHEAHEFPQSLPLTRFCGVVISERFPRRNGFRRVSVRLKRPEPESQMTSAPQGALLNRSIAFLAPMLLVVIARLRRSTSGRCAWRYTRCTPSCLEGRLRLWRGGSRGGCCGCACEGWNCGGGRRIRLLLRRTLPIGRCGRRSCCGGRCQSDGGRRSSYREVDCP